MTSSIDHESHMQAAIEQARIAGAAGNIAVGSVIVRNNTLIGAGHNTVAADGDPTAHAEVMAIRHACKNESTVELDGATLYTSMEPCPMCLWAIRSAGIGQLVLGARHTHFDRPELGGYSVERLLEMTGAPIKVTTGILVDECLQLRPQLKSVT
jgi:tRNA(adenine34) deaminase